MREVYQPSPYNINVRDLDIDNSINKLTGSILLEVTEANSANDGILMVDTDKKVQVKINNTLHNLSIENNEIKFKEIK